MGRTEVSTGAENAEFCRTEPRSRRDRLQLYGLDLRFLRAVEAFADFLAEQHSELHVILHNAAQTVRRPAQSYQFLLDGEAADAGGAGLGTPRRDPTRDPAPRTHLFGVRRPKPFRDYRTIQVHGVFRTLKYH
jgi:hypothetical protein